MQSPNTTANRKSEHLRVNLDADVSAKGVDPGWDGYSFVHCALPELDLADIQLGTQFLEWRLRAPLLISCMTGGCIEAVDINAALAEGAETLGIALGLGSGRVLLEDPHALGFDVRGLAPSVPLFANLGAVQLNRGVDAAACGRLIERVGADGLVLHLNALQEALQPGGDTCFRMLLARIATLVSALDVPVLVKEVGWGIDALTVQRLLDVGVAAVDIAGAGGTSWSEVERHRLDGPAARVASAFAAWGIPSAAAIREAREAAPRATLIASGGVRGGHDVAVALALGADIVGAAAPFLRAAADGGAESVVGVGQEWISILRTVLFVTGCADLAALRTTPRFRHGRVPRPAAEGRL